MTASNAKARQSVTSRIRKMVLEVLRVQQVPMVVYGVVTATGTGVVSVKQQGATATTPNIRYLDSYSPTMSDTVIMLNVSGDLWIVGKHS